MGEMGKGEMGTAHAGKPPSLPRELRTPLVEILYLPTTAKGSVSGSECFDICDDKCFSISTLLR
jgi:hypothetical protein